MTIAALTTPRRWSRWVVPIVGIAVGVLVVWLGRLGPDWPAQEFRAWSAARGLRVWTNRWYAGQPLPGYSVLYPPISALFGAGMTGVLAVGAALAAATRLAPSAARLRVVGYHVSVVAVLVADLLIGQIPYLLGVAFSIAAVRAIVCRRPVVAAVLAAASSLSSPLAGGFLLLASPALARACGTRRAAPLAAALAGIGVAALYGGAGGPFPFSGVNLFYCLACAALALLASVRRLPALRVLGLTYALAALVAFAVPNPVGGNLARLGQLLALPLLWHVAPAVHRRVRPALAAVAALALIWPLAPAVSSIGRASADPSRSPSYYTGLLAFLHTQDPRAGRLEIAFTADHWEAYYVARHFPIARGWERQTDLAANHVLYQPLTATAYRHWLDDNGVDLVALSNAPIDYGGQAEARLLQHPPGYLLPVWHDQNWRVWRVRDPAGLVTGPASLTTLGADSFTLTFRRPGTAIVRIHAGELWTVTSGEGCLTSTRAGWIAVTAPARGHLILAAELGLPRAPTDGLCS